MARDRLIVAIAGASGAVLGIRALQALKRLGTIEIHLIVARSAARTLAKETGLTLKKIERLADVVHDPADRGTPIRSEISDARGMLVAPCSIEALRAIADEDNADLVARGAEACL